MVKNPPANPGDCSSVPQSGRCPGRGNFPVFLPGKFHGQRGAWLAILHGVAKEST